jgi:hypothetical protein
LRLGPNHSFKKLIRDLSVKFQGQKYNFEKVQGLICKINKSRQFARIKKIIFIM